MRHSLLIASHNDGKAQDIASLLLPYHINLCYAWNVSLSEVEETASTFRENAILKVVHAVKETGLPSIADDCGLEVEGLNNRPGIYSKRFASRLGSWEKAMEKLIEQTQGGNTTAYFCCAIAIAWPGGVSAVNFYRLKGMLVPPRGSFGAGFDPCFLPHNSTKTFGEMTDQYRNRVNHRAKAFDLLRDRIDWTDFQLKTNIIDT